MLSRQQSGGLFIFFWKPPPLRFIKVNFDDSVRSTDGGAVYVIRNDDERLLAIEKIFFHYLSIPEVKFRAAWIGIIRAIHHLHTYRIIIENDSFIIIT